MALERRSGGVYLYHSRRVGGRVVKEYAGSGKVAVLAAELDRLDAARRAAERAAARAEREEVAALDAPLAELDELSDLLVKAALVAAGFHQHHRGEWRRRRGPTDQAD